MRVDKVMTPQSYSLEVPEETTQSPGASQATTPAASPQLKPRAGSASLSPPPALRLYSSSTPSPEATTSSPEGWVKV